MSDAAGRHGRARAQALETSCGRCGLVPDPAPDLVPDPAPGDVAGALPSPPGAS